MKIHNLFGAAAAVAFVACATPALAQVPSTVTVILESTDPTALSVPDYNQPCSSWADTIPHNYETLQATVTAGGTYTIEDLRYTNPGYIDPAMGFYSGTPDPNDATVNCVAATDDNTTWTLAPGVYTVVVMALYGGETGTAGYTFNGPGSITFGSPGGPAVVPTMTEWAMILFGTLMAGGAALFLQRRQLA